MKAKIRQDIIDQGLLPSVQISDQNGLFYPMNLPVDLLNTEFESYQPDDMDNNEYNTIIVDLKSGRSFMINSIELDFIDDLTTYQIPVTFVETRKVILTIVTNKNYDHACKIAHAHASSMFWGNITTETKFIIGNKEST